jgi:WD40 repeat protein
MRGTVSELADNTEPTPPLPKRKPIRLAGMIGIALFLTLAAILAMWLIGNPFRRETRPLPEFALQRLGTLNYYCFSEPTEIHYSPDGKSIVALATPMLGGTRECRVFTLKSGKAMFCPRIRAAKWDAVVWRIDSSLPEENRQSLLGVAQEEGQFRVSQIEIISNSVDWQTMPFPGELVRYPLKTASPSEKTDNPSETAKLAAPLLVTTKDAMHLFDNHTLIGKIPFPGITAAAISNDGKYLACAHSDGLSLWDIEQQAAVSQTTLAGEVMDLTFFNDSSQLAMTVNLPDSAMNTIDSSGLGSRDGSSKTDSAGAEKAQPIDRAKFPGELRLWDLKDGTDTTLLSSLSGIPFGLRINRHGNRILVDTLDKDKLFDVKTGRVIDIAVSNQGGGKGFSSAFHPLQDQMALSGNRLSFFSARYGSRLSERPQHIYQLAQVESLDDGRLISREFSGPTLLWDVATGIPATLFEASKTHFHVADNSVLSFVSHGRTDDAPKLVEVSLDDGRRTELGTFPVSRFYDVDHERLLVAGAKGDISVMLKSGTTLGTPVRLADLSQQPIALHAIFLPGTDLIAIEVFEGSIFLANYLTGEVATQFAGGGAFHGKMAFAPQRRELIYWYNDALWRYRVPEAGADFSDQSLHRQLSVVEESAQDDASGFPITTVGSNIAISPDEQLVAISANPVKKGPRFVQRIRVLAMSNGEELASLYGGHQARISWLCFTPDSQRLVSASDDTTLIVWDVRQACKASIK